jgi:hypothetical protein
VEIQPISTHVLIACSLIKHRVTLPLQSVCFLGLGREQEEDKTLLLLMMMMTVVLNQCVRRPHYSTTNSITATIKSALKFSR